MRKNKRYLYAVVLCIHVFIACVAFLKFRMYPADSALCDYGDGLKNYYTLLTFVKEPFTSEGIFKYNSFKYPYGDYVYYTDNTALFSVPFRWFCHYVWDISDYTLIVFNCVVILNLVLCGLLLFRVFRRLCDEKVLSIILSVIFTWTNSMVLRIPRGHFNLSFSSLILLAVVLIMLWHKYRDNRKRQMITGGLMCLLTFCGAMIHGYYSAILGCFIAANLMTYGLLQWRTRQGITSMIAAVVLPVISLGLTLGVMISTDKYFSLRKTAAGGYDWSEQKVNFCRLFSHYKFQSVFFPVSIFPMNEDPEVAAYLGNIGLYSFVGLILAAIFSKNFRENLSSIQRRFFSAPLNKALFISGLIMLSISFGENYYTAGPNMDGNRYHITNILNPFFYLHFFTDRVEQFRSLERIMWPFWFTFNIWIGYTLIQIGELYGRRVKIGIVAAVLLLGGAELKDYIDNLQSDCGKTNYLSQKLVMQAHSNPAFADCQAIIPIPFYIVGSETPLLLIDDLEGWSNFTYRLSLRNHLPLVASKLSRTPPVYDSMIMNMMTTDRIDSPLYNKLSAKPILVAVNKKLIVDNSLSCVPAQADRAQRYWLCNQFATRRHLVAIDSCEDVVYYKWYPKN